MDLLVSTTINHDIQLAYLHIPKKAAKIILSVRDRFIEFNKLASLNEPTALRYKTPEFCEFKIFSYDNLDRTAHEYLHHKIFQDTDGKDHFIIELTKAQSKWIKYVQPIAYDKSLMIQTRRFWVEFPGGRTIMIPYTFIGA